MITVYNMKSSEMLRVAIMAVANQIGNQKWRLFDDVMAKLLMIEDLHPNDVDLVYD